MTILRQLMLSNLNIILHVQKREDNVDTLFSWCVDVVLLAKSAE